jgi:hypothetical protein
MPISATSAHPLDHPIWSALTTRQQALAEGGPLARRYPFAIAPFAATVDTSPTKFRGAERADVAIRSGRAVYTRPRAPAD